MWRTFDLIWSVCLAAAISLAMVGLLFASVLAGRVYRESARADAAIHERVLADNACTPREWRERAKCYPSLGACVPNDWRERATCFGVI